MRSNAFNRIQQMMYIFLSISFSSFNTSEVDMVIAYIKTILCTERSKYPVNETDIGVVTPYASQAEIIENRCGFMKGLTIGPAEVLQGKEKQVIIVSTVSVGENSLTNFVTNYRVL